MKNPSLSTNTWESIKSLLPGQTYTYSQGGYKIYASHLDEYDAQYYMVVFVLEREIFEPITAIQNENIFEKLMEAAKVCSLGQITEALFKVGGQYRRNM